MDIRTETVLVQTLEKQKSTKEKIELLQSK
jgi:hypothetical protein